MSDNPFEAPKSEVSDIQTNTGVGVLKDIPAKMPIGFGWKWIKEGFQLFKQSPLIWILITVIFLAINIIPFVSIIASLFFPIFVAGFAYGAHELEQGRPLAVGYLFKGFKQNTGSLFALSGLYILGFIICFAVALGVMFSMGSFDSFSRVAMQAGSTDQVGSLELYKSLLVPGLIYLGLVIPLVMAIWFAPVLIILHDMGAVEAMKRSFNACLKNMLPFLLYGVVFLILFVLGMIPLFLGLLVVFPLMYTAMYASYKDIFLDEESAVAI